MKAQALRTVLSLIIDVCRSHLTAPRSIRELQSAVSRELMLEVTLEEAREIQSVLSAKGFRDGSVPTAVFSKVCAQVVL